MPEPNDHKLTVTPELIARYCSGDLDGNTMHAIEKQMLEDPFLAEAIEGYARHDPNQSVHLEDLRDRLKQKSEPYDQKTLMRMTILRHRTWWTAAAAVFLLAIGLGIFFLTEKPEITHKEVVGNLSKSAFQKDTQQESLTKSLNQDTQANHEPDIAVNLPKKPQPAISLAKNNLQGKDQASAIQSFPNQSLDTTQVVAYGTQKKENITGSVTIIPPQAAAASGSLALQKNESVTPSLMRSKKMSGTDSILLITGQVRDVTTQAPLAGVTVRVLNTDMGTLSDSLGIFRLSVPARAESLRFAYIGYQPQSVAANYSIKNFNISMAPVSSALNETVVVGYGGHKKGRHAEAHPAGGFEAFEKYLKDSLRYPPVALRQGITGVVTLSFVVMPDSILEKIRIKQSLGYGCDDEAIRLLKEGPQWIPAVDGKRSRQQINISFYPKSGQP